MDKFNPALPVPEGVPNGQVEPFKVSLDHPPGPYARDVVTRIAQELTVVWGGQAYDRAAYEAAKLLLAGVAVLVPTDPSQARQGPPARRSVLVPRLRCERGPARL